MKFVTHSSYERECVVGNEVVYLNKLLPREHVVLIVTIPNRNLDQPYVLFCIERMRLFNRHTNPTSKMFTSHVFVLIRSKREDTFDKCV